MKWCNKIFFKHKDLFVPEKVCQFFLLRGSIHFSDNFTEGFMNLGRESESPLHSVVLVW